ncbi:MAG: hypothetical protein OXG35_10250 [Acidobacteria bacterium]|nr:hypothetical protein [Acidobacteriota bacterium]
MPPVMSSRMRQSLNLSPGIFGESWGTRRWSPPRIRWQSGLETLRRFVARLRETRRRASRFSHEWVWLMTEIERQLTAALRALSAQYEREQKQQAERIEGLQQQVSRLEEAVKRLSAQYERLVETLRT